MTSVFRPESTREHESREVWDLIEEVVPELKQQDPKTEKPLNFFKANSAVWNYWKAKDHGSILYLWMLLLGLISSTSLAYASVGHWFCPFTIWAALMWLTWLGQIVYRMWRSRKEIRDSTSKHEPPALPSMQEIHSRFLDRMKSSLTEAGSKIVGPSSEVSLRLASLDQKIAETKDLLSQLSGHTEGDPEVQRAYIFTEETLRLFEDDKKALVVERDKIQERIRELDNLIPSERNRFERAELIAKAHALRGDAVIARPTSRKVVEEAIGPLAKKFIALNTARETLVIKALARSNNEPGAISRFLKEADRSAKNIATVERKGLQLMANDE